MYSHELLNCHAGMQEPSYEYDNIQYEDNFEGGQHSDEANIEQGQHTKEDNLQQQQGQHSEEANLEQGQHSQEANLQQGQHSEEANHQQGQHSDSDSDETPLLRDLLKAKASSCAAEASESHSRKNVVARGSHADGEITPVGAVQQKQPE